MKDFYFVQVRSKKRKSLCEWSSANFRSIQELNYLKQVVSSIYFVVTASHRFVFS